jgi:hypothetical protein
MVPRHSSETSRPVLPSFFMRIGVFLIEERSDLRLLCHGLD